MAYVLVLNVPQFVVRGSSKREGDLLGSERIMRLQRHTVLSVARGRAREHRFRRCRRPDRGRCDVLYVTHENLAHLIHLDLPCMPCPQPFDVRLVILVVAPSYFLSHTQTH